MANYFDMLRKYFKLSNSSVINFKLKNEKNYAFQFTFFVVRIRHICKIVVHGFFFRS